MKTLNKLTLLILALAGLTFGQVITSTQTLQSSIISASHSGTIFITPVGNVTNGTEANVSQLAGIVGTVANLYVNATAPGGSDTIIVTIDKNTTGQTLTCTVSAAGTACSDVTHSFTVVATDLLSIKAVFSTAVTGAVSVTMTLTNATGSVGPVNNHTLFAGSAPTISSCGTSPTDTNSTDNAGVITTGTGNVSSCTATFATVFTNVPSCRVFTNSNASSAWLSSVSTTAFTVRLSQSGATKLYYSCF